MAHSVCIVAVQMCALIAMVIPNRTEPYMVHTTNTIFLPKTPDSTSEHSITPNSRFRRRPIPPPFLRFLVSFQTRHKQIHAYIIIIYIYVYSKQI